MCYLHLTAEMRVNDLVVENEPYLRIFKNNLIKPFVLYSLAEHFIKSVQN